MVGLRLRLRGGAVPDCLDQTTTITNAGKSRIGGSSQPLVTYPAEAGTRATRTNWIVIAGAMLGDTLTLTTTVGGNTQSRALTVGMPTLGCAHIDPCLAQCPPRDPNAPPGNCDPGCICASGCFGGTAKHGIDLYYALSQCQNDACTGTGDTSGPCLQGPSADCTACLANTLQTGAGCMPPNSPYCGKCVAQRQACLSDQ